MNVMLKRLHSIVKRSNALTIVWLSELHLMSMLSDALTIVSYQKRCCIWSHRDQMTNTIDVRIATFDRNEIKCTDDVVWCQKDCIWFQTIKCIDEIVCDQNCCIRCWNHQMHWRNYLIVRLLHSIVKQSNARWRLSVAKIRWSDVFCDECRNVAFDVDVIKCTLTIVSMSKKLLTKLFINADETSDVCWNCRLIDWLENKLLIVQSKCRFLHLIDLFRWLGYRKLEKAKWIDSYETFKWNRLMFFRHEELNLRSRFQIIVNNSWIAELFFSFSFCRNQMKNIIRKTNSINNVCEQSSNVERFFWIVWMFVFIQKFFTFDVFFIENINFALISFSKTVINNKSVENQKCFFYRHFAEIRWKI